MSNFLKIDFFASQNGPAIGILSLLITILLFPASSVGSSTKDAVILNSLPSETVSRTDEAEPFVSDSSKILTPHETHDIQSEGTVIFSGFARNTYGFDVFSLPVSGTPTFRNKAGSSYSLRPTSTASLVTDASKGADLSEYIERRHTDGKSMNYNAHAVRSSCSSVLAACPVNAGERRNESPNDQHARFRVTSGNGRRPRADDTTEAKGRKAGMEDEVGRSRAGSGTLSDEELQSEGYLFVSERQGEMGQLYFTKKGGDTAPIQLTTDVGYHDRPQLVPGQDRIIYAYTGDCLNGQATRRSCTAVYSLDLKSKEKTRLSPLENAEYSPSVSPDGEWVAVASMAATWAPGEDGSTVDARRPTADMELPTSVYIFRSRDGSDRRRVTSQGGWPVFGTNNTIYFHRKDAAGFWGIYELALPVTEGSEQTLRGGASNASDVMAGQLGSLPQPRRLTPSGVHVLTPAVEPGGSWLAVATIRPPSDVRHIEILDLSSLQLHPLTYPMQPLAFFYNPFVFPDSSRVGYHRCRSALPATATPVKGTEEWQIPHMEQMRSPSPNLAMARASNVMLALSNDGKWAAQIRFAPMGVVVMRPDGDGTDKNYVYLGDSFGLSWHATKKYELFISRGPWFEGEQIDIPIVSISLSADGRRVPDKPMLPLTAPGTGNNAFSFVSPDGTRIVFRSGRSGHKNLYIMDSEIGERGGVFRLTEGAWTDTMPTWSPDGEWIAFTSTREGAANFAGFIVHPNGTGLRRVLKTGNLFGRVMHLAFSPDSQSLVFTTDLGGFTAEPVSAPVQFQGYGEIFTIRLDGTGVRRLTFNPWEEGTPLWAAPALAPNELSGDGRRIACGCDNPDMKEGAYQCPALKLTSC